MQELNVFKLASWNVNSLKIRHDQVLDWLSTSQSDVLALQETKITDPLFPLESFIKKGYHVVYSGQSSYNGVAIISKFPISDLLTDIPNFIDSQRRILAVTIQDIRIINLYVPNGSTVNSDKYIYKCDWLVQVTAFIKEQLTLYPKLAVVGDFNIAPEDRDVHNPALWEGSVLVSPRERQAFADILNLGLCDSYRQFPQEEKTYSWWDYRMLAFRRNHGLRIDHILMSDDLKVLCNEAGIDKLPRKAERPSDHAPVWAVFDI
jgi:exodeoxyribonuclease-3